MIRLVVIDDHPLVIKGIAAIIELEDDMEVAGKANSGNEGLELIASLQPDVVIVDLKLNGEYGLDIVKKARELSDSRFIILTTYSQEEDVRRAMKESVEGYILKEALPEEIVSTIRQVNKGRKYIDPSVMQDLVKHEKKESMIQLTPREKEVLAALAQGKSNRDIAGELYITEYTVKKHVSQILDKLELADRTQAALYAVSRGLGPD